MTNITKSNLSYCSTTYEVNEGEPVLAVIGIGAFEQHSYHLPLDTDYRIACHLSSDIAERLEAFLLQPLPYSTSLEHIGFSGTVTLRPETLSAIVIDIADAMRKSSVSFLAVVNCHGGNFVLNPTIRNWNMAGQRPRIMLVSGLSGVSDFSEDDLHAGELETSVMLHLEPELVRMEQAVDFRPDAPREDLTHFGMKGLSPSGVWGTPSVATPGKGKRWYLESVENACKKIEDLIERWTIR